MRLFFLLLCSVIFSLSVDAADPPDYFEFASNVQVPPSRIRTLATKYKRNIMVGGDSGHRDFWASMKAAKAAGVLRHVYLEGPGGPTGNSGIAPDELARMKKGARFAGINPESSGWMQKWNKTGWKIWTRHQIKVLYAGFDSYEIDNLPRGIGESGNALVSFLKEQQEWAQKNGVKATILLKENIG